MFARTNRLLLRPGWVEDAPALAKAITDKDVARNLSRLPYPYGEEDARAFLTRERDPLLPDFLAFARTRGAPRLVGGAGLIRNERGEPELGYWIARPFWGLGFATEAARAVMGIARATGIRNIRAAHMIDNPASGSVLRKLGFRPTGRIEERFAPFRNAPVAIMPHEEGDSPAPIDPVVDMLYRDSELIAA